MNKDLFAMYTIGRTTVAQDDLVLILYQYLVELDAHYGKQMQAGRVTSHDDLPKLVVYNHGEPWVSLRFVDAHGLADRIGLFSSGGHTNPTLQQEMLGCLWDTVLMFYGRHLGPLKFHKPLATCQ